VQHGRREASLLVSPDVDARPRHRWWVEVAIVLAFYGVYTLVRNTFGSAQASSDTALANALDVIRLERAIGLFHEQTIQSWFVEWHWFMRAWNVFYGTFHFIVTIGALILLFRRHPERYLRFRTALSVTTAGALIGFSLYPLMPPRLLDDCTSAFGGCRPHGFVDSLASFGGTWSFDSGAMQSISNQYAAMPSLHFGWAMWCSLALVPVLRSRIAKGLIVAYPWITLFAIVVTANHYWIDAVGGGFVLAMGFVIGQQLTRLEWRLRFSRMARIAPPAASDGATAPALSGAGPVPAGAAASGVHDFDESPDRAAVVTP
jgi:hypothetical protein